MRAITISCVLIGLLASVASARTWTSADGMHHFEGEYGGVSQGRVILIDDQGNKRTVPLERLSKADQEFVKSQPADAGRLLARPVEPPVVVQSVAPQGPPDRFDKAVAQSPNKVSAYVSRGIARTNQGRLAEALADFNKVLQLDPENPTAFTGRGRVYVQQQMAAEAHRDFSRAIEIDPKYATAYKYRADNLPDYFKTTEGKARLDEAASTARRKRDAIAKKYLQKFPWQPPHSTSGEALNRAAIRNIANVDYAMFASLERRYRGQSYGGGGGGGGGGGVSVGGTSVAGTVIGSGVVIDGVLEVYPKSVYQGQQVTIVANPSMLVQGMPQMIDPDAPKPRRGQQPITVPQNITSVDFYRDSNRDNKLDKDSDEYLGSDTNGTDGYSISAVTTDYLPGNQAYFAVPKGSGASPDEAATGALILNESLLRATATAERNVADQAAAGGNGDGLTAAAADALGREQAEIARLVNSVAKKLQKDAPDVAQMLADVRSSLGDTTRNLRKAKASPGAGSRPSANEAASSAQSVADQLDAAADALAKLTGNDSGDDRATDDNGRPTRPPTSEANAGAAGQGTGEIKLAGGGSGRGGGGGNDDKVVIHNRYGDDDDDRVVIHNNYDDQRRRLGFDDDDETVDLADRYVRDRDYDRAIVEYDRLIRNKPYHVGYLRDRARTYQSAGNYEQAILDYSRAIPISTQNYDFYYNRGCAYLAANKYQQAVDDFTKSIALDELRELGNLAYNNRGITLARLGDYEKALADFNTAIEINGNDRLAYHNRALAYSKLGMIAKAQADIEFAKQLVVP